MPTDKKTTVSAPRRRPASAAALAANRRNAQRSTGPRTPAGKAASSQNALRHGLRARFAVLPGENSADFRNLCRRFAAYYRPADTHQHLLVEQMAIAYWKLARIGRLEARLFSCYSTDEDPVTFATFVHLGRSSRDTPPSPDHLLARALVRDTTGVHAFSHLSNFEMRLERSFHRASRELRRLQSKSPPPSPRSSDKDEETPGGPAGAPHTVSQATPTRGAA